MNTANAVTGNSGNIPYFVNGDDGFRVGVSGHSDGGVDYADLVNFNFSQSVNAGSFAREGGKLRNLYLMLCDIGVISESFDNVVVDLLKMGKVKRAKKTNEEYCVKPRFIGVNFCIEGKDAQAVVGSGVSFYIFNGNVYRSSSAVKKAMKSK